MKCRVCKEDYNAGCLCGFCKKCLDNLGHAECFRISQELKSQLDKVKE